jgi:hypothetical protein
MKTIADYIEELKEKYNLESYYKSMAFIGMERQAWSKIQKGQGLSEKNAIRLAQALKIDPLEIIAVSNALKAENNEIKMMWLKLAKEREEDRVKTEKSKK